jgi:hypothetical protein
MMDHLVPADHEDGEEHIRVRRQAEEPVHTPNDVEFIMQEVQSALEAFDTRKAPGEDALTSSILQHVFTSFPIAFMVIYEECLRRGHFATQW